NAFIRDQRAEADLDRKLGAVFAQAEEAEARSHGPNAGIGKVAVPVASMLLPIARRHENLDGLPKQFRARKAEEMLRLAIDEGDRAVFLNDDDGIGSGLQQAAEFLFGALAFREI